MKLTYDCKISEKDILTDDTDACLLAELDFNDDSNKLIQGENFSVLKHLLYQKNLSNKIDLVYIDPPFATNTVFRIGETRTSTVSAGLKDNIAYMDSLLGEKYIEFLRQRLILLRELMSDKSSIYLHIDYKIGHYVKLIMDEVFGAKNFRNDITRIKCSPKNFQRRAYGNIKDLILFYTKTDDYIWNDVSVEIDEEDVTKRFNKIDANGRRYTTIPLHAPGETQSGPTGQEWRGIKPPKGRHWRSDPEILEELDKKGLIEWSKTGNPRKIVYADEAIQKGKKLQDIWEYKDLMYPDYPTQKNQELLDLIIKNSSDKDCWVMDCFAGSGTTLVSATNYGRKWIGIDQSEQAISVIKNRLKKIQPNLFMKMRDYQFIDTANPSLKQTNNLSE
jgi:adenine-specific DNA-methyltransferase